MYTTFPHMCTCRYSISQLMLTGGVYGLGLFGLILMFKKTMFYQCFFSFVQFLVLLFVSPFFGSGTKLFFYVFQPFITQLLNDHRFSDTTCDLPQIFA